MEIALIIITVVVILLIAGIRHVPVGEAWVYSRWSQQRTIESGWHWVWPLIERRTRQISLLGRSIQVQISDLTTQDGQSVSISGTVSFQVLDADKAAEEQTQLDRAARDLTESATRELLMDLSAEAMQKRSRREMNSWLNGLLNQSAASWGVRIIRTRLKFDIQPDKPGQKNASE